MQGLQLLFMENSKKRFALSRNEHFDQKRKSLPKLSKEKIIIKHY
jgi:hypothetical protein